MMNKPVIAIVPLYDQERDSLWMHPGYMDGVIEAGGIPVIAFFSMMCLLKERYYLWCYFAEGWFKSWTLSSSKSRILRKIKSKKRWNGTKAIKNMF